MLNVSDMQMVHNPFAGKVIFLRKLDQHLSGSCGVLVEPRTLRRQAPEREKNANPPKGYCQCSSPAKAQRRGAADVVVTHRRAWKTFHDGQFTDRDITRDQRTGTNQFMLT